jgi:SAM-dependent methyltransferase
MSSYSTPELTATADLCFADFPSFQAFIQSNHHLWADQVQQTLRLIALNGIVDPLSTAVIPAQSLQVNGTNFRESIGYQGCVSRHRAVLMVLQQLLADGMLPPAHQITAYCPEAITPFAGYLRGLIPLALGSEYVPDPSDPIRQHHPHQDLCDLTFTDASFDLVVCNDVFEHLYDLPAALAEITRVLVPGGYLVSTFPFIYSSMHTVVKARHRPGAAPGVAAEAELLTEPEFHGNPAAPELGSLVYQYPGWELLDQARAIGLADPVIRWIASPRHGVLGQEIPAVMVLVARRISG